MADIAPPRRAKRVLLVALLLAASAVTLLALVWAVRMDRYRIPSENMAPTVEVGEHVSINRFAYRSDDPAVGDIVILHPPVGAETNECAVPPSKGQMCAQPTPGDSDVKFIKRVVAGPGDRVAMRRGRTVLNGVIVPEAFVEACSEVCDFPREITVPAGHYVMLGDNRGSSDDSRFWGPVREAAILGRVDDCVLPGLGCKPRR